MNTLPQFLSLAERFCDCAVAQNKTYGHFLCDPAVSLRSRRNNMVYCDSAVPSFPRDCRFLRPYNVGSYVSLSATNYR